MLWMGIWVHPCYPVIPVHVGAKRLKFGVRQSWSNVLVSWLMLQTTTDCITHLYWMETKCLSTFICCGWAYAECTLALLYLCRWRQTKFGNLGSGRAETTIWCHGWGYKPPLSVSNIHIGCKQSGWAHSYTVNEHIGTPYTVICAGEGKYLEIFGNAKAKWHHGWCCKPLTASHIHVGCMQSVWAPSYAVDGHMGAPLHCYTCAVGGWNLEKMWYDWAQVILQCHGRSCKPLLSAFHIHIGCIQSVWAISHAVGHPYTVTAV